MGTIKLKDISTRAPKDADKEEIKAKTAGILQELDQLQNLLYAESKHAILIVLQGMDASGKDGVIRKVFTSMNPQGVRVNSFKVPTSEELSHDFLWRVHKMVPPKGILQVFNRSHYEDVLITRVHGLIDDKTAKKRMKAINDFEWLLQEHNNTSILKFYLHISPEEQEQRLRERISNPAKQWKYNEKDFEEAKLWNNYMNAYEDCFEHCNDVPWTIVPADQNWYKEYIIAHTLKKALEHLDMHYPGLKKD
jgi:PPK2 family polyphosphate:nucleotide phosphotransferase